MGSLRGLNEFACKSRPNFTWKLEPLWKGVKVCRNGLDLITKMATTTIW